MSANRTQWIGVGLVVLSIGGFVAWGTRSAGTPALVGPGATAPAFRATSVPDAKAAATVAKSIADYRGKAVLLNLWATWCGPCREEMPRIQRLQEELGPQGLAIVDARPRQFVDAGGKQAVGGPLEEQERRLPLQVGMRCHKFLVALLQRAQVFAFLLGQLLEHRLQ